MAYMDANELPFADHTGGHLVRPLGALEEFIWLLDKSRPAHFVMAAEVCGPTMLSDWCRALDSVQARHPLFSVRIAKNKQDRPCFYQERTALIPFRVVQGTNATQRWESEAEYELSIPFDPTGAPLVRAVLLHEKERAVCLLTTHHSIADGRSAAFVIRDLLEVVSGKPVDRLPVMPPVEDILGVSSTDINGPSSELASSPERPAFFITQEETRPRIKGLSLTTQLTSQLRQRARQEGSTVHGALLSAFALAFWEVVDDLSASPVRIMSPIDVRKPLGLGEDCGVLVAAGSVTIEPCGSTTFWEIARSANARLRKAQTLEAIKAVRYGTHQLMKQGLDVSAVATVAARGYAHDIMLSNIGPLEYQTEFGELRLEAVWGPAFSARLLDAHTIGVATTNGAIRLVQTTFAPLGSLLETVEKILGAACVTRKPVIISAPSRRIRSKSNDPSLC
jgi:NRPS condensation-like uncharacterized protein